MKKRGFTLAEIMVALSLIGIVTSLTIPTFISQSKNKATAGKLSVIVSSVENAFTSMIASEAVQNLSETRFAGDPSVANLSGFLKITSSHANFVTLYNNNQTPFRTLSGDNVNPNQTITFETKNGAYLIYHTNAVNRDEANVQNWGGSVSDSIGRLTIDVNGSLRPNVWGRDVFYFRIGNDGILYPAGSLNFSILENNNNTSLWNTAGSTNICTDLSKNWGCTARLVENNYEVDY